MPPLSFLVYEYLFLIPVEKIQKFKSGSYALWGLGGGGVEGIMGRDFVAPIPTPRKLAKLNPCPWFIRPILSILPN